MYLSCTQFILCNTFKYLKVSGENIKLSKMSHQSDKSLLLKTNLNNRLIFWLFSVFGKQMLFFLPRLEQI